MKVWLYGRLSNDDDVQMNSLENQMEILRDYAFENAHKIVGESFDDNVSGIRFDRQGLEQVTEAAENGLIQAVLAKDLSRLGRHRIQTSLFIDYLRQQGVAVLSVTEHLNTLRDEDDLIIGIQGIVNDFYAKDIGNKIRHGYRQKQQEGIVITPPFGYWKDRNTGRILLHPEASVSVRAIYTMYSEGLGQKEIARQMNVRERKTPQQLRDERQGKSKSCPYRWTYQSIHNILSDVSYTGMLVNHKTETHDRKWTPVPKDDRYAHENFYPPIVSREEWEQVQKILQTKIRPYKGNQRKHRYAGLLTCGDCGGAFTSKIRCWNGGKHVEYVCNGYMHHGKEYCPSHSIREDKLDAQVMAFIENLREQLQGEQDKLTMLKKQYDKKRPAVNAQIQALTAELDRLEQEVDEIIMEQLQAK